jgi:hypothetical protein
MVWFGGATMGSFVWNASADPIKNRVMGMVMTLSGRNIKGKHNNQPIVSICGEKESGEVARGGWVRGETLSRRLRCLMERSKIYKNTIHGGIYWPPIVKLKHNNQPKTGNRDGGEHRGDI